MKKLWMSWSSGKDSAFALAELRRGRDYQVTALFTTVNETHDRVAMHSTRRELLQLQAEALGLPLHIIFIPAGCTNEQYETAFAAFLTKARAEGVAAFGYGDLFLTEIRAYRERTMAGSGIEPVFPLWGRPTPLLARQMIEAGVEAVFTCVDPRQLPASFAGAAFTAETIAALPGTTDPCGENGEFHSFVTNAPGFRERLKVVPGEIVERDGFVFADFLPA